MAEIWLPKSETRAQTTEDGKVRVWTDMHFSARKVREPDERLGFSQPPPRPPHGPPPPPLDDA